MNLDRERHEKYTGRKLTDEEWLALVESERFRINTNQRKLNDNTANNTHSDNPHPDNPLHDRRMG